MSTLRAAPTPVPPTILAAGGVVMRRRLSGRQVLLVRRRRYAHETGWTLPKGKVDRGESAVEAALREVREEAGCRARLGPFAGCVRYLADGIPKLVLYWRMSPDSLEAPGDSGEVVESSWMTVRQALRRLHYASERRLLQRALRCGG